MTSPSYLLPKQRYKRNTQGKRSREERRVGVEIEMSGVELRTIADIVQQAYGGEIVRRSNYEYRIEKSELGNFSVEFDSDALKKAGRELQDNPLYDPDFGQWATDAMALLAQNIVPCELTAPPIAMSRLARLDEVVSALRHAGAKGTRHAPWYAFGVHYNVELPDLRAKTIVSYLKAYLCLNDWLVWHEQVYLTRKIPPYINEFPTSYALLVLNPDYWPELPQLIEDYLTMNPTRNRILDMLPLFDQLDHELVSQVIDDVLVRPRPTLHYRLPNSDIDAPHWSLSKAWNDWMQVESLANDPQRLDRWCYRYWLYLQQPMKWPFIVPWKEQLQSCLVDLSAEQC